MVSEAFDAKFYLHNYTDVANSENIDPVEHFCVFGWREGRNPSAQFSTSSYLEANHDVRDAGINPFYHYLAYGKQEGRDPSPSYESELDSKSLARARNAKIDKNQRAKTSGGPPIEAGRRYKLKVDHLTPTSIRGWSVSRQRSSEVFSVELWVDGWFYGRFRNDSQRRNDLVRLGITNGVGGFLGELKLDFLSPGEHTVSVIAPDGTAVHETIAVGEKLKQSGPLVLASGEGFDARVNLWNSCSLSDLVVVVPVYNAVDDLRTCIERLTQFTPTTVEIVFIDDASTDPEVISVLKSAEQHENIRVLHNAKNLGFTRTINRGLSEAGDSDVVILNSDARVTTRWLQGMRAAARSRPRVATVTAMSDRAGAFSAPKIGNENELPKEVDENTYARAFRRRSAGLYPSVPTGNGFCMYISRACLREIGELDADAFPQGYGEENDFCMRAGRAGWVNLIDDRTYVFHDRSKSFGDRKADLMKAGRAIVDQRYPEYKKAIAVYERDPGIVHARFCASQAINDCLRSDEANKTRVLYVVSTLTGGTPQTNRDLMEAIDDAVDGWLLRCSGSSITLSRLVDGEISLSKYHMLSEPVDPVTHLSNEYDAVLTEWLLGLDPDIVHIRHLGWHGLTLPKIAKELGISVVFSFHDFYTLCPNVKLIDAEQNFCGGKCTSGDADCNVELWAKDKMPRLRDNWVHVWRERFSEVLKNADAYITTSNSARDRLAGEFEALRDRPFHVIPHGRDFSTFGNVRQTPKPGERIRVLVPGNISSAKGLDVIEALVRQDESERLEFHILGDIDIRGRELHPRIVRHGRYARGDFHKRASDIEAHVGAVFSIWDETYCHTLTELWSVGLPALVFEFPTVAGRVRESGAGWVLDHSDIPALYNQILALVFNEEEMAAKASAVEAWQNGYGRGNTTRFMAASYLQVYRTLLRPSAGELKRVGVVCPQEESLLDANASTQIRVWERTLNRVDRDLSFIRLKPESLLDLVNRGSLDGALIQRTAIPPALVERVRESFRDKQVPFIMELDDDLLDVPSDKDPSGQYEDYAPLLSDLIGDASAVFVSTASLAAKTSKINQNTIQVPNLLSDRFWRREPPQRQEDGFIRALYMGTATHAEDLKMIMPALNEVSIRYPQFRVSLIGVANSYQDELPSYFEKVEIPAERRSYRRFVGWLREQSSRFDFAIAPLESTTFNSIKSDLKVLEYGALGLPVIASDTPVYRPVAAAAPGIKLAQNTKESWRSKIEEMLASQRPENETGEQLRNWVVENRMLAPTIGEYDRLLKRYLSL